MSIDVFPRLAERRRSLGGQLSGGEQQMLAIGRAGLVGPDLMVLDEPSEGLAPVIIEKLEEVLVTIKGLGMPILLVEQNYHLATRLADKVYVLARDACNLPDRWQRLSDEAKCAAPISSV